MIQTAMTTLPLTIEGRDFAVIRTRRKKTISLRIRDGRVEIVVPRETSETRIAEILADKMPWLRRQLADLDSVPDFVPKAYESGETFTLMGETFTLIIEDGLRDELNASGKILTAHLHPGRDETRRQSAVAGLLQDWYQQEATDHLTRRCAAYSNDMGVSYGKITVKHYKSRWGSCSSVGDLTFNWRIMLAPPDIVDYVVVHELAHLVHHNHSPAFWQVVGETMPDYKQHRAWLKLHGSNLRLD